ncbi:MAG: peptidylprolyl isomerase [Candidatus Eisenbacteria bacterium]
MHRRAVSVGMISGLVLVTAALAVVAGPDPVAPVAQWKGGEITVSEYLTWYRYGAEPNRKPPTTLDEKLAFLNTLINAKLMIEEAESLGIAKLPIVADFYNGRRTNLMIETLQTQATLGRVSVDQRDIDDIYAKRLTEMDVSQIQLRTQDEANALADSIEAGVPFPDLATRYSISPTGERGGSVGTIRYGDFAERWSAQAYRLETGQVSQPFWGEGGYYILKMDSKSLVEPADPAGEKTKIRNMLEQDEIFRERIAFLDSLRAAYDYSLDIQAVVNLCTEYALAIANLGDRPAVLDQDIVPELTDAERRVPLVTFKGSVYTTGDCVDFILRVPYQIRPRVDDPDEMEAFVNKQATDKLMVVESEKRGLDKLPQIVEQVEKARRRKTLFAFYDYITRDLVIPEPEAQAFYDANVQYYTIPQGWTISKIVVGNKEAADSVLVRLGRDESFEEIARARSRDAFTAPEGGNVGFIKVGDDAEFDSFLETMSVGEKKSFRSLEGYVVLWLREKHEPRQASFGEARASVEQRLVQERKDEYIQKWVTERRTERQVAINKEVLEQVIL